MLQTWFLLEDYAVIDKCIASSSEQAEDIFASRGHANMGDILSEEDLHNEQQLNNLENSTQE